ncbi:hypothetical protein ACP70R_047793 [Stipagrostis hirtigluma subsp. patula]
MASHGGVADANNLDDLMQHLDLQENEELDIMLNEDFEELRAQSRWMAMAKVNTSKAFSHLAFCASMRYAWSLAQEVKIKVTGENLFVLQFSCLGDWNKVMDEGPWNSRGNVVLVEPYDGISKSSSVVFKRLAIWIRIYDFPVTLMKESVGKELAARIGEVVQVEVDEDRCGWGHFLRVRVKIDITKTSCWSSESQHEKKRSGQCKGMFP